jgi:predicted nucleic acid-binding Zn ribbon protein
MYGCLLGYCADCVRTSSRQCSRQASGRERSGYAARMPIYEYESVQDGEVIELLRLMKDADLPVEDPAGKGRSFRRRVSVFGVSGGAAVTTAPSSGGHIHSGGCGCGKPRGSCGN